MINSLITMTALVRSSATGALLRSVRLPAMNERGAGPAITAAGDDRHFVISIPAGLSGVTRFYLLTLRAGGRKTSLATLPIRPIPAKEAVTGIALTPDGAKLAITAVFPLTGTHHRGPTAEIKVVDLVTGLSRVWTTHRVIPSDGGPAVPSWADGGRLLGFAWDEHDGVPDRGFYLLHAAAPGHDLLAARRLFKGVGAGLDGYLTSNGRLVITEMFASDPTGDSLTDGFPSIVEYSARTGHLVRTLYGPPRRATPAGYDVAATDPSGKYLLVTIRSFGRFVNGKFTRLAIKPGTVPIVAW